MDKVGIQKIRTGWADADLLWSFPPDGGDDGN
ncbi:MAG: hypothetical protein ACI9JD_004579, partial [Rhodococcus sp. (in: high G+C Gram-positive bacteria)]